MKRNVLSVLALLSLLFVGCATSEGVLVLNSVNGTNLFMRNTYVKTKNSKIMAIEFDITVNVEKDELLENPIVKYTYTVSKNDYSEGEKAALSFENNGVRYNFLSKEYMFRSLDSKKNMQIRYASEMDKEDFMNIMKNFDPVNLVLTLSNGDEVVLSDKNTNIKINDLRVLVN